MFKGPANGGQPPYAPTASFDSPVAHPEPTIIEEILRVQAEVIERIQHATGRLHDLRGRLVGPMPESGDKNMIAEGRRFSEHGQLGQAYHLACSQRDSVAVLHEIIDHLKRI